MYMNCFSAACHACKCIIIHRQILQTDTAMISVGGRWSGWWWIRATSFSLSNGRIGCSGCCFLCIGSRFTGLHGLRRSCIWIHSGGKALITSKCSFSLLFIPSLPVFLVEEGGICRVFKKIKYGGVGDTRQREMTERRLFISITGIKLINTLQDCLYTFCCLFYLFWFCFRSCVSVSFPQSSTFSSMSSFLPMVYLALTAAILHRAA